MKSTVASCRGVHGPAEGTIERKAMAGASLSLRSVNRFNSSGDSAGRGFGR